MKARILREFLVGMAGDLLGLAILAFVLMLGLDALADDTDPAVGLGYWSCFGLLLAILCIGRAIRGNRPYDAPAVTHVYVDTSPSAQPPSTDE